MPSSRRHRSPRVPQTRIEPVHTRPHSAHPGYTNPIYAPDLLGQETTLRSHYYATEPAQPLDVHIRTPAEIRAALQPNDYTSIEMDARVFAPASLRHQPPDDAVYRRRARSIDGPRDAAHLQRDSSTVVDIDGANNIDDNLDTRYYDPARKTRTPEKSSTYDRSVRDNSITSSRAWDSRSSRDRQHFSKYANHSDRSENDKSYKSTANGDVSSRYAARQPSEDEIDVISRVMEPGVTSAPLVASIREELQRLSAVAPTGDSIRSFQQ